MRSFCGYTNVCSTEEDGVWSPHYQMPLYCPHQGRVEEVSLSLQVGAEQEEYQPQCDGR